MNKRQEQLQKVWEELILENLDDLLKSTQNTVDSAASTVKDAAGNVNLDRVKLDTLRLEALASMDREQLEKWVREAIHAIDTDKLERWAKDSLRAVDADKYKRLMRDKLGKLDKDKLDEMLKEGMRYIDRKKLESLLRARIQSLSLEKVDFDHVKSAAVSALGEIDPRKIESFVNNRIDSHIASRVDSLFKERLDRLNIAELEAMLKAKRDALKEAEVVITSKEMAKTSGKKSSKKGQDTIVPVDKKGTNPIGWLIGNTFRLAFFSAAGWIAYSHLFLEHQVPLPKAIAADLLTLAYRPSGPLNVYQDRSGSGRPLVLIHSINAAASSYELRPLFQHYRGKRPVYALDLPGFGFSARPDIEYTPEIYVNAILTTLTNIEKDFGGGPVDVVALSLGSEFAAEAARRRPELFNSLALISPSGLYQRESGGFWEQYGHPLISMRLWARPFYDLLTTRKSIGYYLQKSLLGPIPEGMVDYSVSTSHQPGAEHAPLYFVTGKLFTANAVERIYRQVQTPTMVIYDRDGYVRFDRLPELLATNKAWQATKVTPTLGLPQWEKLNETTLALEKLWENVPVTA